MTSRIQYNNPNSIGWLGLPYHYEMVSDQKRVLPFKQAIEMVCSDKIVLESGTGSGILSLLAARAGAKQVYTVEFDPIIAEFAIHNIENNIYRNIEFIQKDIFDVTLDMLNGKKIDVVIAENLSTWQVTEPEIKIMNHINQYLAKENAIRLPSQILNCIELVESQFRFEDIIELRSYYFLFSGITHPKALSNRVIFREIDLQEVNSIFTNKTMEIDVLNNGVLNSLKLMSPLRVYDNIKFENSDSLMPPVVVPLKEDLCVNRGDRVRVEIQYETNTNWDNFHCSVEKVN